MSFFAEAVSFGVKASLEYGGFVFVFLNSCLTIGCYLLISKYNLEEEEESLL